MAESSPLSTGVDALVDLINERRTISFAEAAAVLGVPVQTVEAWASFLEEEGLLKVQYSFTKPYLVAAGEVKKGKTAPTAQIKVRKVERERVKAPAYEAGQSEVAQSVIEESSPAEDLLGEARDALAAGDIARAKQVYERLEQQYKTLPRKVEAEREALIHTLSTLNQEFLSTMGGTDKESERIAHDVRDKLGDVQTLASKGDVDGALEAFNAANDTFNRLTADAAEVRLSLTPLLSQAQQTLLDMELSRSSKDWETQLGRVEQLMNDIEHAIDGKDVQRAYTLYEQLEAAKKALPPLFAEKTVELEHRMLPTYERIVNMHIDLARRDLQQKMELIATLQGRIDTALKNNDNAEASKLYEMAKRVYLGIPNEFFEKKVEAQKKLLIYARRISEVELSKTTDGLGRALTKVEVAAENASRMLLKGEFDGAHNAYNQAVALFAALPKGFIERKAPVQRRLVNIYTDLLRQTQRPVAPISQASPDEFAQGMQRFQQALQKKQWETALSTYDSLVAMNVPSAHAARYAALSAQAHLLRRATSLSRISDKEKLQRMLQRVYQLYRELHTTNPEPKVLFDFVRAQYLGALDALKGKRTKHAKHGSSIPMPPRMQVHEAPQEQVETDVPQPITLPPSIKKAQELAPAFERPVLKMSHPLPDEMPPALPVMATPVKEQTRAPPVIQAPEGHDSQMALPDEQWVEVIQMWHEAVKQGRWDVALNVADVFHSLGAIPQDRAFEVSIINEQADLLRQAQELGSYPDIYMRRAALQRFYDRYNETVRDHPGATLLYQHLKSLYVSTLLTVTKS